MVGNIHLTETESKCLLPRVHFILTTDHDEGHQIPVQLKRLIMF